MKIAFLKLQPEKLHLYFNYKKIKSFFWASVRRKKYLNILSKSKKLFIFIFTINAGTTNFIIMSYCMKMFWIGDNAR